MCRTLVVNRRSRARSGPSVGRGDRQPRRARRPLGDLRHRNVVGVNVLGELRLPQPLEALVLPPRRDVLEVGAQSGRLHAAQAEADVLGVADDAARRPPVQLVRGLGLATPERAVDPQQHARDRIVAASG
jgi:hypothetical protein